MAKTNKQIKTEANLKKFQASHDRKGENEGTTLSLQIGLEPHFLFTESVIQSITM